MAELTEDKPKLHENGVLTLDGMKATIRNGGTVLYAGKFISKEANLPTATQLAKGNPTEEKKVAADLQRQMKDLQAQLDDLRNSGKPSEEDYTPSEFQNALSGYIFIGKERAKALVKAGFDSKDKVLAASNEELSKVKGFETSETIKSLRDLLNGGE